MYPIAQVNFKMWNDALVAKDYAKVASLYSLFDLTSVPSSGGDTSIQRGQPTMERFADFLKSIPIGTVTVDAVQSHGDDAYLHTGVCEFPGQTTRGLLPVRAQFAYIWRRFDSLWKITYHQSWAVPIEELGVSSDCVAQIENCAAGPVAQLTQLLAEQVQTSSDIVEEN